MYYSCIECYTSGTDASVGDHMPHEQLHFDPVAADRVFYRTYDVPFPSTRYQGSKADLVDWLWQTVRDLEFTSVLDVFGGTGVFAHHAKRHGKTVHYNDYLEFNYHVGRAIIENDHVTLTDDDITFLCSAHDYDYPSFIQDTFAGVYYTDDENAWLDRFYRNLQELRSDDYKYSLAVAALAQACLAKRPFNLFHRANLDMRTSDVDRSFGNKTTWDRPFDEHFRAFAEEYNAAVFATDHDSIATNRDVREWTLPDADLVYMDPPYCAGASATDYRHYYHFLEGFLNYEDWSEMLDNTTQTKSWAADSDTPWTDPETAYETLDRLVAQTDGSHVAISTNTDADPSVPELVDLVGSYKSDAWAATRDHQYVLSTNDDDTREALVIGRAAE